MSRLPIEKMSAAFAGLRGSKSKVEMTVLFVFQALGYRGPFCKNRRGAEKRCQVPLLEHKQF